MIRAVAWFCAEHHGILTPAGKSWQRPSPSLSASANAFELIGRPVNYFPRMTTEARFSLCASSMALKAANWPQSPAPEIGIASAGFEGCLAANQEYFRDYVACGRTLGRGNLFIYTLPTSVLGEVAIVLCLTGPSLFIHDDLRPLPSLLRHAQRIVADREADGMLALWSDPQAAVCMAIDAAPGEDNISKWLPRPGATPSQLAREYQSKVQQA